MKKTSVAVGIAFALFITACGNNNNNTTTDMPDSGYEQRTDTTNSAPVTTDAPPRGAVGVDSINMGQTHTSGVPDSSDNKQDSAGKR